MAKPSTPADLCPDHEHAATECARKNGHDPDGSVADRVRANLAIACTPGRHCPPLKDPMNPEHPKVRAEREAREEYRRTHSADGYALGSTAYPNNREGRRAIARTWKRANR